MQLRTIHRAIAIALTACAACGASPPEPQNPPAGGEDKRTERKELTPEECTTHGGSVVGDIGDGATHRPDYVCPGGSPPLGNIAQPPGGPIATEGAVCCPR
ncbi:MAG TPA: hypothetical protein VLM79_19350 [Kofleriaceae bacterium]|nr:hypothetical protein [Kofleriaceae bacterium]